MADSHNYMCDIYAKGFLESYIYVPAKKKKKKKEKKKKKKKEEEEEEEKAEGDGISLSKFCRKFALFLEYVRVKAISWNEIFCSITVYLKFDPKLCT